MQVSRTWIQFGMLTGSAAAAALLVNFGIGRLVEIPAEADPALAGVTDPAAGGLPAAADEAGGLSAVRAARTAARLERPRSEDEYVKAILDRNIFDQSKVGLKPVEGGDGKGDGPAVSDINVQLTGTVVADPPSFSAAFLLREGEKVAYAYGIGQTLGNATILEILADRVKFSRNGSEEWLYIGGHKEKAEQPAAATGEGEIEGIEQISETQFAVQKSVLDAALGDMEALSKLGRPLLHRGPDGEYDGYRLSAIRRGSLADKLGIRNGDIVHSVNGTSLNSVQGAMQAFQGLTGGNLSAGSKFQFEVTRRGQPVTLSYDVK